MSRSGTDAAGRPERSAGVDGAAAAGSAEGTSFLVDAGLLKRLVDLLGGVDRGLGEPATRFDPLVGCRQEPTGLAAARPSPSPARANTGILDLARRLRSAQTDAARIARDALAAAQAATERYGAFLEIRREGALDDARKSAGHIRDGKARSLLDGVPVAVKDVLDVEGCTTTAGSGINRDNVAGADAACVARLREAGAVIVGKAALHEWAYGVTSDNPFFGTVRNPADPARIPGGSSGGSAAAVASGAVPAALGTDTGGSVRIPAAACGIVGYKPTYDRISRDGCIPQAWSLDHVGTLTTSVADAWLLAEAASRGVHGSFESVARALDAVFGAPASLAGARLGVLEGWEAYVSETVGRAMERSLERLRSCGARLVPFRYPDAERAWAAWLTIIIAESAAYHADNLRERPHDISPDVRVFLETGAEVGAQHYLRAQQLRRAWAGQVHEALRDLDAVLCPTLPDVAPPAGVDTLHLACGEVPLRDGFVHYQWPANLSGAPSISLPVATPGGGLPVGLLLTGKAGTDAALLELAMKVERCLDGRG